MRKLWYRHVYLPKQIAKYIACMPHSLHRKFAEFLQGKNIRCVEVDENHVRCPFCGYIFSKKGYERHLLEMHYDALLQIIDEYFNISKNSL